MLPHDELGTGPAVVLLHAGVADRSMWSEHLEPLAAAGYRVVAFELSGFGEALAGPGPWAPWSDVVGAMDELDIEQAAVVGNSFGGAVALRVAVVAPSRVSSLALVSAPAPGIEPSPQLKAAWEQEEQALERGDIDAAVDAVVRAWTLPDAPAPLRERVAEMQRRTFRLQGDAGDLTEAPDPLDEHPDAVDRDQGPRAGRGRRARQGRFPRRRAGAGPSSAECQAGCDPRRRPPGAARTPRPVPQPCCSSSWPHPDGRFRRPAPVTHAGRAWPLYSSLGSMFVAIAIRLVKLYIAATSATSQASSRLSPASSSPWSRRA